MKTITTQQNETPIRKFSTPKNIIIVEDHTILRDGLKSMLATESDLKVIGEADDGIKAVRIINELKPDIVVLDLNMPRMDGVSVIKEIRRAQGKMKILALTMHRDEEYILEAFRNGADGYCIKSSSAEEVITAIRIILSGKQYVSPDISDKVLEGYLDGKKSIRKKSSFDSLTQREKEILKLIGEGYQNKEISTLLCISIKTVEKHRSNLIEKLDIHSASGLTAFAISKGLVAR